MGWTIPTRGQPAKQTPDVEAAVERLENDATIIQSCSPNIATVYDHPERRYINSLAKDLRTILASHAALVERAKADGEAFEQISNAYLLGYRNKGIANIARARLQAREGGVG